MSSTINTGSSPPTLSIRSSSLWVCNGGCGDGVVEQTAITFRPSGDVMFDVGDDTVELGDRSGEAGAVVYKLFDDTIGIISWSDISR